MEKIDLRTATIESISERIKKKEVSPVDVINAFLERIEEVQKKINAFITVLDDKARKAAKEAEEEIVKGHYRGPLHGIPLAAKDLFYTQGTRTTCGSRILADFFPTQDATVVTRLLEAGAILIGKTNMHEFAYGCTNLNDYYGHSRNPWDITRITGGSSGGSAAAVAGSCALLALGSDTGGSIRIPSALCGIVGLKPTFGRISRYGVQLLSLSLDCVGPMTRTVADAAIALKYMAGYDQMDTYSSHLPVEDYWSHLSGNIKGMRIGVPENYFFEHIEAEVEDSVMKAIEALKDLGAKVRSVHIEGMHEASVAATVIISAEAAYNLEEFHYGQENNIGEDVKSKLDLGALCLAKNYIKAQHIKHRLQERFREIFDLVDVLITPGVNVTSPTLEQTSVMLDGEDVPMREALLRTTLIYNLVGLPSISIPIGFSRTGLPIGLQIASKPFNEGLVLRVGDAYEREVYKAVQWPELS